MFNYDSLSSPLEEITFRIGHLGRLIVFFFLLFLKTIISQITKIIQNIEHYIQSVFIYFLS